MGRLRKRVLIIDDDEKTLNIISDLASFLGYRVEATTEALDGVELLNQKIFDLVIVDMIMPQVGGLALSKVIRQEHPGIPIVAISGYYEELVSSVRRPDVDAILSKPLTLEILRATLDDMFSEKRK
jgi:two-component system capsular synthesis sensor histidine kinase RcsC